MKYYIEKEIRTTSELIKPFEFKGYKFRHWHYDVNEGWLGDSWIVSKEVIADNYEEAFKLFSENLAPLLSKISFVSQCYLEDVYGSLAIVRLDDNPEKYIYLRKTRDRGPSKLCFMKEEINALSDLDSIDNNEFFLRMHVSNNSSTYRSRLVSLIHAVESLAGDKTKSSSCNNCNTELKCEKCGVSIEYKALDHSKARKILDNNSLYQKIWGGSGIRNQLMHGREHNLDLDYLGEIYNSILAYVNSEYGVEIQEVVAPQRHFFGNLSYQSCVYEVDDLESIDLKELIEGYDSNRRRRGVDAIFLASY